MPAISDLSQNVAKHQALQSYDAIFWQPPMLARCRSCHRGRTGVGHGSDPYPTRVGPVSDPQTQRRYNRRMVTIYGKDTCPYTQAAREDYERRGIEFTYI